MRHTTNKEKAALHKKLYVSAGPEKATAAPPPEASDESKGADTAALPKPTAASKAEDAPVVKEQPLVKEQPAAQPASAQEPLKVRPAPLNYSHLSL